jgi:hypothetical protein
MSYNIVKDKKGDNCCIKCAFRESRWCIEDSMKLGLPYCGTDNVHFEIDEHSPENLDPDMKIFNTDEL